MADRRTTPVVRIPVPADLRDPVEPSCSPREIGRLITELADTLLATAEVISGSVLAVPEFEAKLGLGYHLFVVTDLMSALAARGKEVGLPRRRRRDIVPAACAAFDGETDPARLLWLAYDLLLGDAVAGCRRVLDTPGGLADGPTRRIVRLHLPALLAARDWGVDAVARYLAVRTPQQQAEHTSWQQRTRQMPSVPADARQRRRPTSARRDERFTTFADTRDYRKGQPVAATPDAEYAADLLEMVRINRDEIDAIETFCLVYFDLMPTCPLAMLHDLARTAWDECRHALLGHELLAHLGLDPFGQPCSMIGIAVRAALGGWDALAQISLFGELNIIGPMRSLAARARDRDDRVVANCFDFICADESLHLRRIRRWLRSDHPLGEIDAITRHTQEVAGRELERAGVIGEDYFVRLSGTEVFELLGE
jgi:hypothetical protein